MLTFISTRVVGGRMRREHVVPLEDLVERDPVDEAAHPGAEQEAGGDEGALARFTVHEAMPFVGWGMLQAVSDGRVGSLPGA
jgi:hypothetical protein